MIKRWRLYIERPDAPGLVYSNAAYQAETLTEAMYDYVMERPEASVVLAGETFEDADTATRESGLTGFDFNKWRVEVLTGKKTRSLTPVGPRKPKPQIVAEVHNVEPINAAKAWAAIVAMCKGE